ncbi:MAG: hypothetical protein PHD83_05980 [Caldisericia bacterium]|nr:hypothetical protein [Caldisericia bacterium]
MTKRWLCFILLNSFVMYTFYFSGLVNKTPLKDLPARSSNTKPSFEQNEVPSIADWAGVTNETLTQKVMQSALSFEPLSNCLYYAPYFIFQATYGEKASDYYLFSLNTQTGELVKIHKGFHGTFLIKGNVLLLRHTDHIFACTIPNWKQLREKKNQQTWDDLLASKDSTLNENKTEKYTSYACEMPSALQLLDWEYIYCVMEGSFTKSGQKELLFISGRKPTYDIGIYTWNNKGMTTVESLGTKSQEKEWLTIASKNEENMVNFRQAVFEDLDKDGCLEIIINGVYAVWGYYADPLLYLDFSQPASGKRFQLHPFEKLSDTEIIRMNHELILFGNIYDENERKINFFRLIPPDYKGFINFTEINPVPQETKRWIKSVSHQRFNDGLFFGPIRKHLSFARTGRNLSDAGNPVEIRSKKWPKLPICPLYNANNPNLTPREKLYHTKRIEFLKQFVAKLDTGWNPFSGFSFGKEKENYLQDAKSAWQMVKHIVDVIPVFELDQVYPVLVIVMNQEADSEDDPFDKTVLCLYNQNWELQHYHPVEVNERMHDLASLILPLPRENLIFANYSHAPRYSACHAFVIHGNEIKETLAITDISSSDVFPRENQLLVQITVNHHYLGTNWGDGGNGVGFLYDYIIDPLTKEIKDTEFSSFFQFKLEYLYYHYHFYNFHGETNLIHTIANGEIINFLERYEKNIYYHELAPMTEDDV